MSKIRKALVADYLAAFPALAALTEWENVGFTPTADCQLWARFLYVEGDRRWVDTQHDRVEGYVQIDFNTPLGGGEAHLLGAINTASDRYIAGRGCITDGQTVSITGSRANNGFPVDAWFRRSVTITFRADIFRPKPPTP